MFDFNAPLGVVAPVSPMLFAVDLLATGKNENVDVFILCSINMC